MPAAKKNGGRGGSRKKPPAPGGDSSEAEDLLSLPRVNEVFESDRPDYDFDRESALKVVAAGEAGYDFHVNMDNVYLRTEQKSNGTDPKLLEARYKYALVLIGLALLNEDARLNGDRPSDSREAEGESVMERISSVGRAISPVLLPMIDSLGDLQDVE